jgi:hypothetical protein
MLFQSTFQFGGLDMPNAPNVNMMVAADTGRKKNCAHNDMTGAA